MGEKSDSNLLIKAEIVIRNYLSTLYSPIINT